MESHVVEVKEAAKKITARMKEMESHMVEKDEHIAERDRKIAEKDVLLARREEDIAEKEKEISSLKAAQAEELKSTEGDVGTSRDMTTTGMLSRYLAELCLIELFHLLLRTTSEAWWWLLVQPSTSLGGGKPMCGRGMV